MAELVTLVLNMLETCFWCPQVFGHEKSIGSIFRYLRLTWVVKWPFVVILASQNVENGQICNFDYEHARDLILVSTLSFFSEHMPWKYEHNSKVVKIDLKGLRRQWALPGVTQLPSMLENWFWCLRVTPKLHRLLRSSMSILMTLLMCSYFHLMCSEFI